MTLSSAHPAHYRIPIGLEEGPDGAVHIHALDLAGCIVSGASQETALEAFPAELGRWFTFLQRAGEAVPSPEQELEITVDEWITTEAQVGAGESNVCFEADRRSLGRTELLDGVRVLGKLRGRLLPLIRRKPDAELEQIGPPGMSVRTLLDELARAQWWTLTRLGASPLAEVPERVVARLDTAMALILQHFAHLPAEAGDRYLVLEGEEWTPRKVLRRLLWLEWTLGGAALAALGAEAEAHTQEQPQG